MSDHSFSIVIGTTAHNVERHPLPTLDIFNEQIWRVHTLPHQIGAVNFR